MANRRMFRTDFIKSDEFLSMPHQSQLLYFYLIGHADDEGFVDNTNSIMKTAGIDSMYVKELISKEYLLHLEDKLFIITHWHQHNKLSQGRKVISKYANKLSRLMLEEEVYKVIQ